MSTKDRFYVFNYKFLHELAQDAVKTHGNATGRIIDHILANLTETYAVTDGSRPKIALQTNTSPENWVLNNAGGAMGAMLIIHASITEYLIIFGTPLGTEGHTGRHTADDYFNILVGEQWAFAAGGLEKEVSDIRVGIKLERILNIDDRFMLLEMCTICLEVM